MSSARVAVLALVAYVTTAGVIDAQIPLSTYTNTFSSPTATRGFFFQAPGPMVVTGLQVPDEIDARSQVVALYNRPAAPPQYPATSPATPVFFAAVTQNDVIAVVPPVTYQTGDWVGVLGAAGAANASLHSSYGAGNFSSHLLGQPITLLRMVMRDNIGNNSGVGDISAEGTTSIARVRVFVRGQGQALTYGSSSSTARLAVADPLPPSIGYMGGIHLMPGQAANAGGLLAVGSARASMPTPFGDLLVTPILLTLPVAGPIPATGTALSFHVPNNQALLGTLLTFQAAIAGPNTLTFTNGIEWTVGR